MPSRQASSCKASLSYRNKFAQLHLRNQRLDCFRILFPEAIESVKKMKVRKDCRIQAAITKKATSCDLPPIPKNRATAGRIKAGQNLQQCLFATAITAHQKKNLPSISGQVERSQSERLSTDCLVVNKTDPPTFNFLKTIRDTMIDRTLNQRNPAGRAAH